MKRFACLLLTGACALVFASGAYADPGKGRGHGKGHDDKVLVSNAHTGDHIVVFSDNDRGIIRNFIRDHGDDDCPPGLAKKHNGCLPPGQAAKHYRVGETIVVNERRSIWQALADMISPPPAGYHYARVDRDVYLVNDSNRVIDVVRVD